MKHLYDHKLEECDDTQELCEDMNKEHTDQKQYTFVHVYPDYATYQQKNFSYSSVIPIVASTICVLLLLRIVTQTPQPYSWHRTDTSPCVRSPWREPNIPRVIHTFTNTSRHCIGVNVIHGFQTKFWTISKVEDLIHKYYPDFYIRWLEFKSDDLKIEASKYIILHKFGGIFINYDKEMRCYRNGLRMLTEEKLKKDALLFTTDNILDDKILGASRCSLFLSHSLDLLKHQDDTPFSDFMLQPTHDFLLYSIATYENKHTFF